MLRESTSSHPSVVPTSYCFPSGNRTHRQQFRLSEVPEAFPEVHVQVLCDALELSTPQLGVNRKLPTGKK